MIQLVLLSLIFITACAPPGKSVFNSSDVGFDHTDDGSPELNPSVVDAESEMDLMATGPFPEDTRKFNKAWNRNDAVIIIDAYQGNSINWSKMATDRRVAAVIHRTTMGLRTDTLYKSRQVTAQSRGYLWGAYHLGTSDDPIAQAKAFLKVVGDTSNVLLILDLEDTSNSKMMNVAGAKKFMAYVYGATGKIPVVYANHSVTKILNSAVKSDPLFKKSRLWYARFRSNIPDFPRGIWPTYFLWQFSSEINCSKTNTCLYNVPGTLYDMDVNVFYGGRKALEAEWYK